MAERPRRAVAWGRPRIADRGPWPRRGYLKPGAAASVKAAVAAARGSVRHETFGRDAMAIEVPAAALNGLARNPNVDHVEPDEKRSPLVLDTPSAGNPCATGQKVPCGIGMVQADGFATADLSKRKVCIIDYGYDRAHEDLSAGSKVTGECDSGTGWW